MFGSLVSHVDHAAPEAELEAARWINPHSVDRTLAGARSNAPRPAVLHAARQGLES